MTHVYEGELAAPAGKIGIVASRYNGQVTEKLLEGALATLAHHGVASDQIHVAWVPGAWEIPAIAARWAGDSSFAAVLCLGVVIRGETMHDQYINHQVSQMLGRLAVRSGKPVLFGVLTCNNLEQAWQRSGGALGNKGSECAEAALRMANLMAKLPGRQSGL